MMEPVRIRRHFVNPNRNFQDSMSILFNIPISLLHTEAKNRSLLPSWPGLAWPGLPSRDVIE